MQYLKIGIFALITISVIGQDQQQVNSQTQVNNQQVQKHQMPRPIVVQPVAVDPIPAQTIKIEHQQGVQPGLPLPNVVNPDPNMQMPQPIPVQPDVALPVDQAQHQAQPQQPAQPQIIPQSAQPVQPSQAQQSQPSHTQQPQQPSQQQPQQHTSQTQQQQQVQPQQPQRQAQTGYRRNVAVGQQQNRPDYDNPDAQRSARYRAEQQRLNQIRRKQRQLQQKRAREMGVGPNPNVQVDRKINRNQLIRNQQRQNLHALLNQQLQSGITFPKKTVMFQVDKQIQQYIINPTTQVTITLRMLIYVLENNAYGFVKDVDKSKSLKVYVYEDNARIVAQVQFFFESGVKFVGKPGSTYVVRFYNDGQLKLISLTYPNMLQAVQMNNLYSKQKGLQQITKTQMLSVRIEEVTQRLRRNSLMDRLNNDTMMDFLRKYSGYQFIEMLVVIVVSAFQVHMVKSMFQSESIL